MKSGILILEQVRTGKPDTLAFKLTDELYTKQKAWNFFRKKMEREKKSGNTYKVSAEFEVQYQARTISQNNLLRALERIIAMEEDGTEETYEEYHEGLLDKYAPLKGRPNPVTGKRQRKRTREMNTVEMAEIINGAFIELATKGVQLSTTNIANYWVEWYRWRGKQGRDPFTETARTAEEYKRDVPVCEACLRGLNTVDEYGKETYQGQLAHIVSRAAGGPDEPWNWMHLCTDCHLFLQHQNGWVALVNKHPHVAFRVAEANLRAGKKERIKADPAWNLVSKEMERIERGKQKLDAESAAKILGGEVVQTPDEGADEKEAEFDLDPQGDIF